MSLRANKVTLASLGRALFKSKKPYTARELLKDTLTGTIFFIAVIKTPPLWLASDKLSEYLHVSSTPTQNPDFTKKQDEKKLPEEIKTFLWGYEGLQQKHIIQNGDNCQIMANIIASTFTEEGLKRLESMIEVTDYNLDQNNFYINFNVNMNGKKIPVSYNDLIISSPRHEKNFPQAQYVLAYAIEKELAENYVPNPSGFTSQSTATFFTNKNYSTLFIPVMSDESLIEILKQAPNEIICAGSYPKLNDTTRTIMNILKTDGTRIETLPKNGVISQHEFAVKGYKYENGNHLITLVVYHDKEITLTLDEFRKNIMAITAPTKSFNLIDSKAIWTYLISLTLIIALRKAIGKSKTRTV